MKTAIIPMKKVLKISGIALLALMVILFITPFIFKSKILKLVKEEINKSVNAKVEFKDLSLSLFSHFPKLTVELEDVSVVGVNEFSKDTLISTKKLNASVNLVSMVWGKDIKVYGIYLESPRIHALVNKNGTANWEIAEEDTATKISPASESAFKLNLQKYEITDGYIFYRDESSNMSAEIVKLDHNGSGDFTKDIFTLTTNTQASSASLMYADIPYLIKTKTNIDADIQIDNKTNTYSFKTENIILNNLKLAVGGFFCLLNDSTYNMDISFNSPSNDFKDILSMVPAIYKKDFDKLKTGGKAVLNGFVKGVYSPSQIPAYSVNMDVEEGYFQYPDLPQPVENIQLKMKVNNVDGQLDHTVVDITKGHFEMNNEPFDFHLFFRNPETSQYLDATVKGKLDLSEVSKFIKLDAGTKLSGIVWADATVKGSLSAIKQHTGPFTANGFLDIHDLFYSSKDLPQPIQHGNLKVQLENSGGIADNTRINIQGAHLEIGEDPVNFSLLLDHPVSTLDFSGKAKGRFTLDNIKQFVKLDQGTSIGGILNADLSFSGNKAAIDKKEYEKINVSGPANFRNVSFVSNDYPTGIILANTQLTFNSKNVELNSLVGNYQNTNFTANGILNNVLGYAVQNQELEGNINLTADKINLNDWMGTDSAVTATTPTPDPFLVPSNVNLTIKAKADQVKYDKVNYNNVMGVLVLKDEAVKLQNVKTEALDGTIAFNGSYSTKENKKHPAVAINYDVKDVDVQKAFFAFNTIQKLIPIGKFIDGRLSSQLSLTGNLNGDMMPDFNSLTGNGNLLLLQGVLRKFFPIEKLAGILQIDELKDISLKDIKNYIEFRDGKVLVKPFTVKVKDIEMQIGGMHGIDQSIHYIIQMKTPRKYLGEKGNALLNGLVTQANNKGIPAKIGDMVNLNIMMDGSITNPTIKTDLKEGAVDMGKELKQQAMDFAQQKIDNSKQIAKDSFNVVKKLAIDNAKEELKNQFLGNKDTANNKKPGSNLLDSSKKKTEETIRNTFNKLLNRKKKAVTE
jgi:hypothetical protein